MGDEDLLAGEVDVVMLMLRYRGEMLLRGLQVQRGRHEWSEERQRRHYRV